MGKKLSEAQKKTLKESVDLLFETYDKDKDGFISTDEMKNYVFTEFADVVMADNPNNKQKALEEEYKMILNRTDKNKDGKVSKEEMINALKQYFL